MNNFSYIKDNKGAGCKNAQIIREEYHTWGGGLVLVEREVFKFVGVDLDQDFDYYYIFQKKPGGKEFYYSCVMGFCPLVNKIDDYHYKTLVNKWNKEIEYKNKEDKHKVI